MAKLNGAIVALVLLVTITIVFYIVHLRRTQQMNTDKSMRELMLDLEEAKTQATQFKDKWGTCEQAHDTLKASCAKAQQQQQVSTPIVAPPVPPTQQASKPSTHLVIGIPTVARPNKAGYLRQTLQALAHQIQPSPFVPAENVVLLVINLSAKRKVENEAFNLAKDEFSKYPFIHFANEFASRPFKKGVNSGLRDTVFQQSLDFVDMLDYATTHLPSEYYLFLEDDMKVCGNGVKSLLHMISKAALYHDKFSCVRCSFGMNGIVMHSKDFVENGQTKNDVKKFANYMYDRFDKRPCDHLVVEYCAKETEESKEWFGNRAIAGYRYNLFEHMGQVSSIRNEAPWAFPGCYAELVSPVTFEVEAFNPQQCPRDDMWPCNVSEEKKAIYPWIKFNYQG